MSLQVWGQRNPQGMGYLSPALGTLCFLLADESPCPGKGAAVRKDTCIQVIPPLCHSAPGPHSWDLPGAGAGLGGQGMCGLGGWAGLCADRDGWWQGMGVRRGQVPVLPCPLSPQVSSLLQTLQAPDWLFLQPWHWLGSWVGRFGGAGRKIPPKCLGRG